ncbi:hypothetical protein OSTOST_05054 [Ostertagia ostertagi]
MQGASYLISPTGTGNEINTYGILKAGRAAGAEILSEIASDFRGLSFATGGQHNLSTQATLSNIFGHFSPGLKGASIGTAKSDEALVAGFNLADSGAFATDLPRQTLYGAEQYATNIQKAIRYLKENLPRTYVNIVPPFSCRVRNDFQAVELVSRIKAYPGIDLDKEWKLINIFIGSNDLCKACLNKTLYGAEQYATNIQKAIRYLKENLPRTYVNIVPPFHVEVLLETQPDNPFCVNLQRYIYIFGHFSPGLKGASIGTAKSDEALVAGFNLADSGAFATDLPRQAEELVSRIKAYPGTDLDKEWKLINIFIGSNDLCKACLNKTLYGAEQYATNIQKAIRYLKENLPRTYVNIVPPFHVEVLLETQPDNPFCVNLQRVSCHCLFEIPKQNFKELKRSFDDTLNAFNTSEFQTNSFAVAISSGVNVDNLATLGVSTVK